MSVTDIVKENELLYRAIKRSKKDCLAGKRITPALFKYEKGGISVDRNVNRQRTEVIEFMRNNPRLYNRVKGVAELSVTDCKRLGTSVIADPSDENPYHANIFLDENDEFKQNIQALGLADACKLVFYNEEMQWTG